MGRSSPRPISVALDSALAVAAPRTPLAAIQAIWPRAAGAAIAEQSMPVSERAGRVTIACRTATWAEQLDLLSARLLERLRAELHGSVEVRSLRFVATAEPDSD
jgi:predicted nucleic acid-binding Zn ribbon protein